MQLYIHNGQTHSPKNLVLQTEFSDCFNLYVNELYQGLSVLRMWQHFQHWIHDPRAQADISEQTNALLKTPTKRKKKGLKALLFRAWKELQGWQHSAWQCDMVAQREHRAMISLSLRVISGVIFFPLPVCWMLHLYTVCLLLSWQKFGMPIFLPQASMLIMLEGLCDRSNVALQEKGHNAEGVQLYFYLQSCRVEKPGWVNVASRHGLKPIWIWIYNYMQSELVKKKKKKYRKEVPSAL